MILLLIMFAILVIWVWWELIINDKSMDDKIGVPWERRNK